MQSKPDPFPRDPPLPYPSIARRRDANGQIVCAEYIIPDADREKVLRDLCPFVEKPRLSDVMIDIECD
jgi:hypothetical protein